MRYEDQAFDGETIAVDGHEYINCTFNNCRLIYGGGPLEITPLVASGFNLEFTGAALAGVEVYRKLQESAMAAAPQGAEVRFGNTVYVKR